MRCTSWSFLDLFIVVDEAYVSIFGQIIRPLIMLSCDMEFIGAGTCLFYDY